MSEWMKKTYEKKREKFRSTPEKLMRTTHRMAQSLRLMEIDAKRCVWILLPGQQQLRRLVGNAFANKINDVCNFLLLLLLHRLFGWITLEGYRCVRMHALWHVKWNVRRCLSYRMPAWMCAHNFRKCQQKPNRLNFIYSMHGCKVTCAMHRTNTAYIRFTCLHGFVERNQMTANRLHPANKHMQQKCIFVRLVTWPVWVCFGRKFVRQMVSEMTEQLNDSTNRFTVREVRCHRSEAM